jgi:hypothetical protein
MSEGLPSALNARSVASTLLVRLRNEVQGSTGGRSTESLLELLAAIRDAWGSSATPKDDLLNDVYHFANHYISDEDVMRSNPSYAAKLNEQLDRYLLRLDA